MSDTIRQDNTGHYANVNGLNMYYEIHGTGTPLGEKFLKEGVAK
jgi:hypothetical protein